MAITTGSVEPKSIARKLGLGVHSESHWTKSYHLSPQWCSVWRVLVPTTLAAFSVTVNKMPRRTVQGGKRISGLTVSEKMVAWSHGLREGIVVGAARGREVFTSWWA